MTVRDGASYLPETLDSLSRQTFRDYELVINDNGSTDETPSILAEYAAQDRRVRLLPPLAGNDRTFTQGIRRAFESAMASLVAVNDADDVSAETRLEKQVGLLDANPDIVAVASWFDHIDGKGRIIASHRVPAALFDAYQTGNPIAHSSMMYRREKVLAAGGYCEHFTFASNFDLQIAIASAGGKIAVIPEPLIKIRLHEQQTSLMPSKRARFYRELLEILKMASRLPGVSWHARLRGMVSRQKLALRYGLALWNEGRRAESACPPQHISWPSLST